MTDASVDYLKGHFRRMSEDQYQAVVLLKDGKPYGVVLLTRAQIAYDNSNNIDTHLLVRSLAGKSCHNEDKFEALRKAGYACLEFQTAAMPTVVPKDEGPESFTVTTMVQQHTVTPKADKQAKVGQYQGWVNATGAKTGRFQSCDYVIDVPESNLCARSTAPHGHVAVYMKHDTNKVPVTFVGFRKETLRAIADFAADPRAYVEALPKVVATPPWKAKDWSVGKSPRGCVEVRTVEYAVARLMVSAVNPLAMDAAIDKLMEKAYETQTGVTVSRSDLKESLHLYPPQKDDYPPDQKFVCQQCGKQYAYGEAKADMGVDPEVGKDRVNYNPLSCCSSKCADDYRARHMRNPHVGAEILLNWDKCNLNEPIEPEKK